MSPGNLLIMRHEILLLAIILLLIAVEVFMAQNKKDSVVHLAIFLFGAHAIIGFFPMEANSLFGGMFRTNGLIHFFKNILNIGVLILLLQSADWLRDNIVRQDRGTEFFALLFSSLLGMYFMISAGDFLMFYLGLELSILPVAALASYETAKRKSSEAGIKLILSSALASGVSLFGISILYATSGSIYFNDVIEAIAASNLTSLGAILFFAGLGFKISLVPFHFWTADVYEGAPISIASYLSVISKGAAVFILMILLFTVLKSLIDVWENIIYAVATATMFMGNLFALRQ